MRLPLFAGKSPAKRLAAAPLCQTPAPEDPQRAMRNCPVVDGSGRSSASAHL